jgi:hypothetical protein
MDSLKSVDALVKKMSEEEDGDPVDVEEIAESDLELCEAWLDEPVVPKKRLCALVYGEDGTGKSGLVLNWLVRNKKKTLYLDVDGNTEDVLAEFYPDVNYISMKNPIEFSTERDIKIDYLKTFRKMKMALHIARIRPGKYDAIVVDGISTVLDYAGLQTRDQKDVAPDGGMSFNFWRIRTKLFLDIMEQARLVPKVDRFFIGHDDFIVIPGVKKIEMKGSIITVNKTAQAIIKTNRMMDQRIFCQTDEVDEETGEINWIATVHKFRKDVSHVNRKLTFARGIPGVSGEWDSDVALEIFDGRPKAKKSI